MKNYNEGKFKNDKLVSVWGDVVAFKELVVSIAISVALGLTGYLLAPEDNDVLPLLFAITGILIATIINSRIFKPKRVIKIEEQNKQNNEDGD